MIGEEPVEFAPTINDQESQAMDKEMKRLQHALDNIEEDHQAACKDRDAMKKKMKMLEKEIRTLTTWLKKTTTKLSKMSLNLTASQELIPDLTRNVEELRPTIQVSPEEEMKIEELTTLLDEKTKIYKSAHSNTVGLERRVEELQQSIMHVGGNDLKRAKAVRKNFASQLKAAEANIAKTSVDIKALNKKIESSKHTNQEQN